MLTASWKLNNASLKLVFENKKELTPSARQIYDLIFKGSATVDGLLISKPANSNLVRFSRFPIEPRLRINGDFFSSLSISLGVIVDGIFLPINQNQDYIISNNTWNPIDNQILIEINECLSKIKFHLDVAHVISINDYFKIRQDEVLGCYLIEEVEYNRDTLRQVSPNLQGLDATLFNYQKVGVEYLTSITSEDLGCIIADEMGLGKTLQVIGLLINDLNRGRNKSLVVCPSSLVTNWERELSNFAPVLNFLSHSGTSRSGDPKYFENFDLIITSYDILIRDIILFRSCSWNLLIADEAQYIKNPEAERSIAIKSIDRRASIAITGTPIENRLLDLWSIFDFVLPNFLDEKASFENTIEQDILASAKISDKTKPFILRRKISEVAQDLPPRIDIPEIIDMDISLIDGYEKIRSDAIARFGKAASIASLIYLREYCTHPSILDSSFMLTGFSKFNRLLDILLEISYFGQKAIIFTSFQRMIDIFQTNLPQLIPHLNFIDFIDGRVESSLRQNIIDNFSSTAGFSILLLNPRAAGVGLNITAANHVIHYNPEWNPSLTDQASARSYRRKQELPVTVRHLYIAKSVEEIILTKSQRKRILSDSTVVGNIGDMDEVDIASALNITPKL